MPRDKPHLKKALYHPKTELFLNKQIGLAGLHIFITKTTGDNIVDITSDQGHCNM